MKNLITFAAKLPNVYDLEEKLKEKLLPTMTDLSYSLVGFIPHPAGDGVRLVLPLETGYTFAVQMDEKIIPKSLVNKMVRERVKEIETKEERTLNRKEKSEISSEVNTELLPKALHRSKVTVAYYNPKAELLMVDTTNHVMASLVVRLLIEVLGTLETKTIHVSGLKLGLGARLKAYLKEEELEGKDPMQGFAVVNDLKLIGPEKAKVSYSKLEDIHSHSTEILALLEQGYQVLEIGLSHGVTEFKLDSEFQIKAIKQPVDTGDYQEGDDIYLMESAVALTLNTEIIHTLCELLGYGKEEDQQQAA